MAKPTQTIHPSSAAKAARSLDESMGYLVRKTHFAFTANLATRLSQHDISISMWFFLRLLWEQDGVTQGELTAKLGLTAPTTVSAIDNLERRGLVVRRRNEADRRKTNVYLTKSGRALEAKLIYHATAVNQVALESLSDAEIKLLASLLHRMSDSLKRDTRGRQGD